MLPMLWFVACSIGAGVGAAALAAYLRQYRGEPGAGWLALTLSAQALFCLAYGSSLLVADPSLHRVLSVAAWAGLLSLGAPFFAFALVYTGRGHLVRTVTFRLLLLAPVVTVALVATNAVHNLVWSSAELVSVGGLTAVRYEMGPAALGNGLLGLIAATAGAMLLLDASFSYGPLYRTEATAVALSTIPPGVGFAAWILGLGPLAPLNLTAVLFVPHVLVDLYAFVGSDMFEYTPTTRRVADRAAVDDLDSPVVVVDGDRSVVDLNGAATAAFGVDQSAALTESIDDVVGSDIDLAATDQVITVRSDADRYDLAVSPSSLTDDRGTAVGHTIVFQDITDERRREQRLDVLNRVLRHNLRNELNVVDGSLSLVADAVAAADERDTAPDTTDRSGSTTEASVPAARTHLERAQTHVDELIALADDARAIENVVGGDTAPTRVDLVSVLETVAAGLDGVTVTVSTTTPASLATATEAAGGGGGDAEPARESTVAADGGAGPDPGSAPEEVIVRTRPDVLQTVLRTLVTATLEHDPEADGAVRLALTAIEPADYRATIAVVTDGVGIPETETAAVSAERETALDHASGLDVWLVKWGVDVLGGDLSFDPTDAPDGLDVGSDATTAATVTLPGVVVSPD